MDGSHRSVIVSKGVKWPNGITLDLVLDRIFWVDAKLNLIGSADLDGANTRFVHGIFRKLAVSRRKEGKGICGAEMSPTLSAAIASSVYCSVVCPRQSTRGCVSPRELLSLHSSSEHVLNPLHLSGGY